MSQLFMGFTAPYGSPEYESVRKGNFALKVRWHPEYPTNFCNINANTTHKTAEAEYFSPEINIIQACGQPSMFKNQLSEYFGSIHQQRYALTRFDVFGYFNPTNGNALASLTYLTSYHDFARREIQTLKFEIVKTFNRKLICSYKNKLNCTRRLHEISLSRQEQFPSVQICPMYKISACCKMEVQVQLHESLVQIMGSEQRDIEVPEHSAACQLGKLFKPVWKTGKAQEYEMFPATEVGRCTGVGTPIPTDIQKLPPLEICQATRIDNFPPIEVPKLTDIQMSHL